MILKTLISKLRCVWLGLELNSAGVGQICPTCTVISLDSLNLITLLCMVLGERLNVFAILHCEMWFLIFLTLLSWNLAQSDEPWSNFACKDWNAPFIPKHDTLTYYQLTCLLWSVWKQFNMDIISPFPLLCVAAVKNYICSCLHNTFTLVSENFGYLFFVLLSIK